MTEQSPDERALGDIEEKEMSLNRKKARKKSLDTKIETYN